MRNGSTAVAGAQVASTPSVLRAVFLSHTSRCRTMRNGSIAVAGAQVASIPSVSRTVSLSHTKQVWHYAQMADTHYCYGAYLQRRHFRGCRAMRFCVHMAAEGKLDTLKS